VPNYLEDKARRFTRALEAAGFEVQHYDGRSFFSGPSATVSDRHGLLRAIRAIPEEFDAELQWDNLGRGYVLYGPRGKETAE
jgi:hypothetical protein